MNKICYLVVILFFSCASSKKNVIEYPTSNIPKNNPRNIIFLIGDGMSLPQLSAWTYMNNNQSVMELFPVIGVHKSYSSNDLITDSAAGATAFACGIKTKNGYLGVDSTGKHFKSIMTEASEKGYKTGMVVTSTIVHATPAAFLAHQSGREDYEAIAKDYSVENPNLLIGGGEKFFSRRTTDSLNLKSQLVSKGYTITDYFENDFTEYQIPDCDKFIYFTADGDPLPKSKGREYLPKASSEAIRFLNKKNDKGFFLMIEGSQIDWGGHANDLNYVLTEMEDFQKTIEAVMQFAVQDKNTLVVITGDHETGGLTINPGSSFGKLEAAFSTKKHTACMVPVYAFGPGAENFSGIYENTAIYWKMKNFLFSK